MIWFVVIIGVVVLIVLLCYGFKKLGTAQQKNKQADKIAKDKTKNAKITSKPFVDNPFGSMRRKK